MARNIQAFRVPSEGEQTSLTQREAKAFGHKPSAGLPTKARGRGMRQPDQAFRLSGLYRSGLQLSNCAAPDWLIHFGPTGNPACSPRQAGRGPVCR